MPKPKSPTPVLATKHKDKRANIPTEELRDFVADDEKAPKKILYPRDPSLDPQLVVENLRETARGGDGPSPQSPGAGSGDEPSPPRREQLNLFASDFNGLKFEHLIEF